MSTIRKAVSIAIAGAGPIVARAAISVMRCSRHQLAFAVLYHRVGEVPGRRQMEFVPALETSLFRAQVAHLRTMYDVVPASSLCARMGGRRRFERFPLSITFDDDLRSHVRDTLPVLADADVSATYFLSGASLETPTLFWWEVLQHALDAEIDVMSELERLGGDVPDRARARRATTIAELAERVKALEPERRDRLVARLRERLNIPAAEVGLGESDLHAICDGGHEIGFHTLRHHDLARVSDADLGLALAEGRNRIESAIGRRITAIAYPHGSADERVARAARAAGYDFGFTAAPVAITPATNPFLLGRFEASFASTGHLALRLAVAAAKTILRRWMRTSCR